MKLAGGIGTGFNNHALHAESSGSKAAAMA